MDPYLPFEFTHEGMLERVSALVQNQVSLYSKTYFNKLYFFLWKACDVITKTKITERNTIEEANFKTRFTKYPWGQCSLNNMCFLNRKYMKYTRATGWSLPVYIFVKYPLPPPPGVYY